MTTQHCLMFILLAFPLTASPQSAPATQDSAVAPDAPVLTIHGSCPKAQAGSAAACTTTLTRRQFEELVNAFNASGQPISASIRRNMAQAYVEVLATSSAAEQAGTQNEPRFKIVMEVVRMRTLSDMYRRDLEDKYRHPSVQEIELYYKQNLSKYEEVKLARIFIPSSNPSVGDKGSLIKEAAQVASSMRERAAHGEDFSKLQVEAYKSLGLTSTPPNTDVGGRRRGMLAPAEEQEIFSLPAGGVSKVEQEPSGYIIYKVESRQTLPLNEVKDEISRELFRQNMEQDLKSITNSVHADYNEQYFGAPAQATQSPRQPRK